MHGEQNVECPTDTALILKKYCRFHVPDHDRRPVNSVTDDLFLIIASNIMLTRFRQTKRMHPEMAKSLVRQTINQSYPRNF